MLEELLEKLKTYKLALGLGALVLAIAGFFSVQALSQPQASTDFPDYAVTSSSSEIPESSSSSEEVDQEETVITVDIKGAVAKEGLYQLPVGSRVNDAITEAGGLLETADKKSINLAQKLTDEAVVYVASQGENISVLSSQSATGGSPTQTGKVNLNTADETQLQTVTGIGAKKAKDILAYRETNGGFKSVDDLKNISGIGDKTLEKIREEVTVD